MAAVSIKFLLLSASVLISLVLVFLVIVLLLTIQKLYLLLSSRYFVQQSLMVGFQDDFEEYQSKQWVKTLILFELRLAVCLSVCNADDVESFIEELDISLSLEKSRRSFIDDDDNISEFVSGLLISCDKLIWSVEFCLFSKLLSLIIRIQSVTFSWVWTLLLCLICGMEEKFVFDIISVFWGTILVEWEILGDNIFVAGFSTCVWDKTWCVCIFVPLCLSDKYGVSSAIFLAGMFVTFVYDLKIENKVHFKHFIHTYTYIYLFYL